MDFSKMTMAAIEAALLSGEFLRRQFNTPHTITSKEGKQNLVTECDLESERLILSFLKRQFPDHGFLSEEKGGEALSSEIVWIIDPLDGTVNFARNIPIFSISIAACRGNEILLGVILQPITGELFIAEKGKGAFLNETKLQVSTVNTLDHALLATGFPYNIDQNPMLSIEIFSSFLKMGTPLRRLGSAALDLAYVAAGRFDSYWETGIHPWDIAAGILLIEEAGGLVSKWNGDKHLILERSDILASNSLLHASMIESLKKGRTSCN